MPFEELTQNTFTTKLNFNFNRVDSPAYVSVLYAVDIFELGGWVNATAIGIQLNVMNIEQKHRADGWHTMNTHEEPKWK